LIEVFWMDDDRKGDEEKEERKDEKVGWAGGVV
jgi:hypothetical protein